MTRADRAAVAWSPRLEARGPSAMRSLNLMLTGRCNLRCDYCYLRHRRSGRMSWDIVCRSIDLLLASEHDDVKLAFTGGEPLLEFPTIRRAVAYAKERCPQGKRIRHALTTNGTRLDEETATFLAGHDFDLRLSCDGGPEAQAHRGADTFPVLDRLLDRLCRDHPDFLRRHVTVCVTLTPHTVPFLADSIDYFLGKGVKRIAVSPAIGAGTSPPPEALDRQLQRVLATSIRYFEQCFEVPVLFLRRGGAPDAATDADPPMCAVMRGLSPAVSPDGRVHGCTVLAAGFDGIPSSRLRRSLEGLSPGSVGDPGLAAGFASLEGAARRARIFHHKRRKFSSFGRCADCRHLGDCLVCPLAAARSEGRHDPHRVDDFSCAFNLASLACRDRFPPPPTLTDLGTRWGAPGPGSAAEPGGDPSEHAPGRRRSMG